MYKVEFVKYHGSGNDFILIDDREGVFSRDSVAALCDRKRGIGADGVILVQRSMVAPFQMKIFNADGSEPAMCGNGLRCAVDFLHALGLIEESVQIETGSGILKCRWAPGRIAVNLGAPKLLFHDLSLLILGEQMSVDVVDTGVPHCIVFVPDVQAVSLEPLGRALRHHPQFFPHGVNVNVVALHENGGIALRTYERGVEGETLACGTGAAAAAWLSAKKHGLAEVVPVVTQGGAKMAVGRLESGEVELIGPVVRVYAGIICHNQACSP